MCSTEGGSEGAARLVRRHDVRHFIPTFHRRSCLHCEAASRPAIPGRRERTPARTTRRAAR